LTKEPIMNTRLYILSFPGLGGDAEMCIADFSAMRKIDCIANFFLAIQQCGLGRSNAQCNPSNAGDTKLLKSPYRFCSLLGSSFKS
jgi:hypothetical protein